MGDKKLTISRESLKNSELFTIVGRIDSSNASQMDEALNQAVGEGKANLILEFSGVSYMSSAALRAMVSALHACKGAGGDVRLANLSERVADVLALAGLDTLYKIFDDATSAIASFNA